MSEKSKLWADGLEVVAWWLKNTWSENDLVGLGSGEHIYQGVYDEKIQLCRLTDAQRLLSQLREELAQRDAEVAKWKALAQGATTILDIEQSRQERSTWLGLESQQAASVERDLGVDCCPWGPESERGKAYMQGWNDRTQVSLSKAASVGGERVAFEAWATHILTERQPLRPELYWPTTQTAWEAWQARAALSSAGGGVVTLPELEQIELPEHEHNTMAVDEIITFIPDGFFSFDVEEAIHAYADIHARKAVLIALAKPQANSQEVE